MHQKVPGDFSPVSRTHGLTHGPEWERGRYENGNCVFPSWRLGDKVHHFLCLLSVLTVSSRQPEFSLIARSRTTQSRTLQAEELWGLLFLNATPKRTHTHSNSAKGLTREMRGRDVPSASLSHRHWWEVAPQPARGAGGPDARTPRQNKMGSRGSSVPVHCPFSPWFK